MKAWATGDCDDGGDEWEQEIRLAEQAVQAINKLNPKPKFFVLCGDLVHAMPGKTRAVAVILSPSRKKKKKISLKKTSLLSNGSFLSLHSGCKIVKYQKIHTHFSFRMARLITVIRQSPRFWLSVLPIWLSVLPMKNRTDSYVSSFFTYRRQTWIAFRSHIHKHNLLLSFPSFLCFYFSCLCSCFFSFKWQANLNWINFFLSLYCLACVLSCFRHVQLFAAL